MAEEQTTEAIVSAVAEQITITEPQKQFAGADNCNAILQGSMPQFGMVDSVGLVIQAKKVKEDANLDKTDG